MLIVFLLIFNIVISIVLFLYMYNEQRFELFDIAKQEINELNIDIDENPVDQNSIVPSINKTKGIFLTYFMKSNNKLVIIDEFSPHIRSAVVQQIQNWKPNKMETKFIQVQLSKNDPRYLYIVSQNIFENGQRKGTIYIGKDVTSLINMFISFLLILFGLSIIFFIIALLVGQAMTKRAMRPIIKSYNLQSEFIADASHELRTPLSVLKSGLDVIEFEEGNKLSSVSKNILTDLQEEIRGTTKLVNNLLLLIRSGSGEQPSVVENFDMLELMYQIMRSFQPLSKSKEIKLELQTQKPLSVLTDREKVKQILYILIDNAIKYTPNGGCVNISYELKTANYQKNLSITISDNGIGIPFELQKRIFDRFYRVDKSRSRHNGSSGLGLPIGKSIIESLNGRIKVVSTPNQGSQFIITIPLQKIQIRS